MSYTAYMATNLLRLSDMHLLVRLRTAYQSMAAASQSMAPPFHALHLQRRAFLANSETTGNNNTDNNNTDNETTTNR